MRTDIKAFGTCYHQEFEGGTYLGGSYSLTNSQAQNLKYCMDLEVLDIGHQKAITDFSFLKYLHNLKYLILALTSFNDMTLLSDMKQLEYLEIFTTQVSDLGPITELPNLKYLNCSNTLITTVDYLVEMNQMEVLWVCSCGLLSTAERVRLKESLPNCFIETDVWGSTRGGWRSYDNQGYIDMREALDFAAYVLELIIGFFNQVVILIKE